MSGTVHEDLSTFYCCRRSYSTIKVLSSSEMVLRRLITRRGINIARTRHSGMLYLHCLACSYIYIYIYIILQFLRQVLHYRLLLNVICTNGPCKTAKMETASSFEMPVTIYQSARRHITSHLSLQVNVDL
jgi:hypothetical protein